MSEPTKQRALRKLDAVTRSGIPGALAGLFQLHGGPPVVPRELPAGNVWLSEFYIAKLHKPVDRTEWEMTPQTYNAYYNPPTTRSCCPRDLHPAGHRRLLVDDAIVYSYAGGTTIGHEITHGFDDEAAVRREGEPRELVDAADEKEFNRRAAMIVRQFDEYVVVDSLHCNGKATQGENIATWPACCWAGRLHKTEQYKAGKPLGG